MIFNKIQSKFFFVATRYIRALLVLLVNFLLIERFGYKEYSVQLKVFLLLSFTIHLSFGFKEDFFKKINSESSSKNLSYLFTLNLFKLLTTSFLIPIISFLIVPEFWITTSIIGVSNIIRSFYNALFRQLDKLNTISHNNILFGSSLLLLTFTLAKNMNLFFLVYSFCSFLSLLHFISKSIKFHDLSNFKFKSVYSSNFFSREAIVFFFINVVIAYFNGIDRIYFELNFNKEDIGQFQFANSIAEGLTLGLESILLVLTPIIFKSEKNKKSIISSKVFYSFSGIILVFGVLPTFFISDLKAFIDYGFLIKYLPLILMMKILIIFQKAYIYELSSKNQEKFLLKISTLATFFISFLYFKLPSYVLFINSKYIILSLGILTAFGLNHLLILKLKKINA